MCDFQVIILLIGIKCLLSQPPHHEVNVTVIGLVIHKKIASQNLAWASA